MEGNEQVAKGRHRKTLSLSLSLSALFHGHLHRRHDLAEQSSPESSSKVNPSKWIRSKHHNNDHPQSPETETKGKCRNVSSRMGRHRRHASDLSYDPLSYSHNFESEDNSPLMNNFTARLRAGEEGEQRQLKTAAEEKSIEKAIPPPTEVKKTRRKSFDLNELMTVAKSLEDAEPIPNGGNPYPNNNNKDIEKRVSWLEEHKL